MLQISPLLVGLIVQNLKEQPFDTVQMMMNELMRLQPVPSPVAKSDPVIPGEAGPASQSLTTKGDTVVGNE